MVHVLEGAIGYFLARYLAFIVPFLDDVVL